MWTGCPWDRLRGSGIGGSGRPARVARSSPLGTRRGDRLPGGTPQEPAHVLQPQPQPLPRGRRLRRRPRLGRHLLGPRARQGRRPLREAAARRCADALVPGLRRHRRRLQARVRQGQRRGQRHRDGLAGPRDGPWRHRGLLRVWPHLRHRGQPLPAGQGRRLRGPELPARRAVHLAPHRRGRLGVGGRPRRPAAPGPDVGGQPPRLAAARPQDRLLPGGAQPRPPQGERGHPAAAPPRRDAR
ncbi:MAG: hypothetical protein ACK559_38875, partial [bacterium]